MTQGFPGNDAPNRFDLASPRVAKIVDQRFQTVPLTGRGFQWWPELKHDGVLHDSKGAYIVHVSEDGTEQPWYLDPGDYVLAVDDGNPYDGHDEYIIYNEDTFLAHFEPIEEGSLGFETKVLYQIRSIAAGLEGDAKAHALAHPLVGADGVVLEKDVAFEPYMHALKCELIGAILQHRGYGYETHPDQPDEFTVARTAFAEKVNAFFDTVTL